jgi:hypothetical protein
MTDAARLAINGNHILLSIGSVTLTTKTVHVGSTIPSEHQGINHFEELQASILVSQITFVSAQLTA